MRVGPGVAATETFRQKEVQRFDADYLLKVREHSAGRNRSVSQLLAIFSFMRNYGAIPATARVDWDRAHVQSIRGDPTSDAAHNLPCADSDRRTIPMAAGIGGRDRWAAHHRGPSRDFQWRVCSAEGFEYRGLDCGNLTACVGRWLQRAPR